MVGKTDNQVPVQSMSKQQPTQSMAKQPKKRRKRLL